MTKLSTVPDAYLRAWGWADSQAIDWGVGPEAAQAKTVYSVTCKVIAYMKNRVRLLSLSIASGRRGVYSSGAIQCTVLSESYSARPTPSIVAATMRARRRRAAKKPSSRIEEQVEVDA